MLFRPMRAEYREEPCRNAMNRVRGMPFAWSLNPYMGCAHRCTFCYVRAFEARADRPWDERYGASIRVKTNVADVLRRELARPSWQREVVAVGAATDPYQPAEGRYRLTRACIEAFAEAASPFSIITRGPLGRVSPSRSPSRRSTARSGAARSRERRRHASGSARCRGSSRLESMPASGWRRSSQG
jgi:DNA repair photolyase